MSEFPLESQRPYQDRIQEYIKRIALLDKDGKFLASEHALAVILPSRDGRDSGGSGGTIFDDGGLGRFTYQRDHAIPFPWW